MKELLTRNCTNLLAISSQPSAFRFLGTTDPGAPGQMNTDGEGQWDKDGPPVEPRCVGTGRGLKIYGGRCLPCFAGFGIQNAEDQYIMRKLLFFIMVCSLSLVSVRSIKADVNIPPTEILNQFKEKQISFYSCLDQLNQLPRDDVIIALCHTIEEGGIDTDYKHSLYRFLFQSYAAQTDQGLQQLMKGLEGNSPQVRGLCVRGLKLTPQTRQIEVAKELENTYYFQDPNNIEERSVQVKIISTLAHFGQPISQKMKNSLIEEFKSNKVETFETQRRAAYALLKIEGIEYSLSHFYAAKDSKAVEAAYIALMQMAWSSKGTLGTDKVGQKQIRDFALEGLLHKEYHVRKAALSLCPYTFGIDLYSNSPEQLSINREVKSALERMITVETDTSLKKAATNILKVFGENDQILKRGKVGIEKAGDRFTVRIVASLPRSIGVAPCNDIGGWL